MSPPSKQNILDTILTHKREVEVPARRRALPIEVVRREAETRDVSVRDFAAALHRPDGCVALIAEIKRASPSKGVLVKGDFSPIELARNYQDNGAACISVLTDEKFFHGSLDHLRAVRAAVNLPLLRKDFVVDAYQIYEARAAGADAVLLIVAALDDHELRNLHAAATELGLAALVEVHDEPETERALKMGARVIGVNNRDLRTFQVDIATTARCAEMLKGESEKSELFSLVSESGIFTPDHVRAVASMGANAILVGESIITSGHIADHVRALAGISV
jgi:indole-3-glycerol phosphate synthase